MEVGSPDDSDIGFYQPPLSAIVIKGKQAKDIGKGLKRICGKVQGLSVSAAAVECMICCDLTASNQVKETGCEKDCGKNGAGQGIEDLATA